MLDCLVVGAGQSGLSCAEQLKAAGFSYLVVDAHARVGDTWRNRPRKLHLFTSRQFCQLGDLPMPGEQGGFPSAGEFADYLEQFCNRRSLNVRLGRKVTRLSNENGVFRATLNSGEVISSRTVIDATGSSQVPKVPALGSALANEVVQLTAASYRDPQGVATGGQVLVVGDGASGRQIAMELAGTHKVMIATGRKRKLVPNVVLGRDIFWWLTKIGVLRAPTGSVVARILRKRDPIPAKNASNGKLARAGVVIKPRTVGADGRTIWFEDGSSANVDTVIWCGGYKEDPSWLNLEKVTVRNDHVEHLRGATAQPGFFVMGRKWLSCRASELVLGAAADAKIVIGYVAGQIRNAPGTPAPINRN
jgi:putative flavoprotein involved in K+ transport